MSDRDDEVQRAEVTVAEISESFALLGAHAWTVSPARTVLALTLATEALALRLVSQQPEQREEVIGWLRSMIDAVVVASGVRH